ncbi:MAG: phosphoribosylaminoimidazolesuccinocarboxamide synthase [Acidobacteriota bacterium]
MKGVEKVDLPLKLFKRGKVRDVYEIDDSLLIISTDRISAFDYILPTTIPDKGKVLNQISSFWFEKTGDQFKNHIVNVQPENIPEFNDFSELIKGRSILGKKLKTVPVEAIVRNYIVGSGWKSYQKEGNICGVALPGGLSFGQKFSEPIFTPTTKEDDGHDENITFEEMKNIAGTDISEKIRDLSISLFNKASEYAATKGIIIADTKFEFGIDDEGNIIIIDEIFTPDSSRFWKAEDYEEGSEPPAYDKQFVRNFLLNSDWDRNSVPPSLPDEVVTKTRGKYLEIFSILTGHTI